MNFDLTEEQRMLQQTVGQLLENECPINHLREIVDGDAGHDPALWKGLVEMGLAGLAVPEEYGGAGLEILDLAVTAETLGYHAAIVVAQRNGFINHEFLIAGSATVEDAFFQTDQRWHTILAFGRGQGGKYLTALDISNAPDWDRTFPSTNDTPISPSDILHLPKLRFTVGNEEKVVDSDGFGENYPCASR